MAVGVMKDEYDHLDVFDDVKGWHIQHCRYVKWKMPHNPPLRIRGLTMGILLEFSLNNVLNQRGLREYCEQYAFFLQESVTRKG